MVLKSHLAAPPGQCTEGLGHPLKLITAAGVEVRGWTRQFLETIPNSGGTACSSYHHRNRTSWFVPHRAFHETPVTDTVISRGLLTPP